MLCLGESQKRTFKNGVLILLPSSNSFFCLGTVTIATALYLHAGNSPVTGAFTHNTHVGYCRQLFILVI